MEKGCRYLSDALYKKNLSYLERVNNPLQKKILKTNSNSAYIKRGVLGKRNIIKIFNNAEYPIHSNYDPYVNGKIIADAISKEDCDIVFQFGLGIGYELWEMQKKNPNKIYLVIEPDVEIFKNTLHCIDIKPIMESINLFIGNDEKAINEVFSYILNRYKSLRVKFVVLPSYKVIYKKLWENVMNSIKKTLNMYYISVNTNNSLQKRWVRNYILNLSSLKESKPVESLKKYFNEKPAIVVSGGPSLNLNIEALKNINDRCIIVAAGSGATVLESNKIKAHIIGAIDGSKAEESIFKDFALNSNTALLYSSQTYYSVLHMFKGKKFLLNQVDMDEYLHKGMGWKKSQGYSGPSIANIVTYNLSQLGCNPIIFLGQDMCYSENSSYAKGARKYNRYTKEELEANPNLIKVHNKKGEEVYTTSVFLSFKYSLENCIKAHPHIKYLNGSDNGLNIEGADNIDFNRYFDDIISNEKKINIDEILKKIYEDEVDKDSMNDNDIILDLHNQNKKIINICEEIVNLINKEKDNHELVENIKQREKVLLKLNLYNNILKKLMEPIEFLLPKNYIGRSLNYYMYVLDKCYIMEKAFHGEDIIKEGE